MKFHLNLQCLLQINLAQILEPQCAFASGKPKEVEWDLRVQEFKTMNYLLSETKLPELECRVNLPFSHKCGCRSLLHHVYS